jgi:hypothetical protein
MSLNLKIGDEVVVLHSSSRGLVLRRKDGKVFVVYPYCSCNSGFWWINVYDIEEKKSFSDSVKYMIEQALSRK